MVFVPLMIPPPAAFVTFLSCAAIAATVAAPLIAKAAHPIGPSAAAYIRAVV